MRFYVNFVRSHRKIILQATYSTTVTWLMGCAASYSVVALITWPQTFQK